MSLKIHWQFPKKPKIGDIMFCKTPKTLDIWEKRLRQNGFIFSSHQNGPYFRIEITGKILDISQAEWDRLGDIAEINAMRDKLFQRLQQINWTHEKIMKMNTFLDELYFEGGSR